MGEKVINILGRNIHQSPWGKKKIHGGSIS